MTNKYEDLLNSGWLPIKGALKDGTWLDLFNIKLETSEQGEWKISTEGTGYWEIYEDYNIEPTHYRIPTTPAEDEANRQRILELIEEKKEDNDRIRQEERDRIIKFIRKRFDNIQNVGEYDDIARGEQYALETLIDLLECQVVGGCDE